MTTMKYYVLNYSNETGESYQLYRAKDFNLQDNCTIELCTENIEEAIKFIVERSSDERILQCTAAEWRYME